MADEKQRVKAETGGAQSLVDPDSAAGFVEEISAKSGSAVQSAAGSGAVESEFAETEDAPPKRYDFTPIGESDDIQQWLERELVRRAEFAGSRLRTNIPGKIRLEISGKPLVFDWSVERASVSRENAGASPADCTIKVSEKNLRRITAGQLNPQIAMLSDKITVEGNLGHAVYFFNLLVP